MDKDNVKYGIALVILGLFILAAVLLHDSSFPTCMTEGCYR